MHKKVFIKTFGCQMNEYDSNRIYDAVRAIGYNKTENQDEADCYILNTCHIRDKAKDKVYHEIGRVKKLYKDKKKPIMVVAGCVAQAENTEMLNREKYIDLVIGPQSYQKLNNLLKNFEQENKVEETEFDSVSKFRYFDNIKNNNTNVSSFLTIQEGCDKFCHFCVVPYTRGPEYSRPFKSIIDEAERLIKNGSREITFLGQNVNAYSYKDGSREYRLSDLINTLSKYSEISRIRYTTSHPRDMTDDLIECYENSKKLMPFVHLPIQSGSDKILKMMNRKHTVNYYLNIYEKLIKINPDIKFLTKGSDIKYILSRGEQKFMSILWCFSMHKTLSDFYSVKPFLIIDDIHSELDEEFYVELINFLPKTGNQLFFSDINDPFNSKIKDQLKELKKFHVEQIT